MIKKKIKKKLIIIIPFIYFKLKKKKKIIKLKSIINSLKILENFIFLYNKIKENLILENKNI
jgi:hypothetical protein